MLKAVIFDMDGVIIDSEPQHARAALRVLNRHGANADYDYCSSFIGSSTKVFTQDIMKRFPLSISLEDLLEEMNLEKKKILKEEGYAIIEGITDLIKKLYHAGIRLAIASSSSPTEIENTVKALHIKNISQN